MTNINVWIDGEQYDITNFVPFHPGTSLIRLHNNKDVSTLYKSVHGRETVSPFLSKMKLDHSFTFIKNDPNYTFDSQFSKDIKPLLLKKYKKAPTLWWFRTVCITILWLYTEYYYRNLPTIINSTFLGILFGFMGLCIGHDGSHGSVGNQHINDFFAHYMDLIGSSSYNWHNQHVRLHHPFTNEGKHDPDAKAGQPLMEIHDVSNKPEHQKWLAPLLWMFGLSVVFNVQRLLKLRGLERKIAVLLRIAFLYRIFIPSFIHGLYVVFVTGFMLSNLFIISHNTPEMVRDPSKKTQCWYTCQVESSCTYGGEIAGFLTGGLNYQIEHHIFPTCNSCYLPVINKQIKEICKKNSVNYTYYPDLWTNIKITYKHLFS
tara:strand:+ start:7367 stop:8485 length:1119 start_codon:yes stop_codon:yes gene_type:complete